MPETLDYIPFTCEAPECDLLTCDGLKGNSLYYRASKLSNGIVISDTIWDLSKQTIFVGDNYGTITELRSKGISWKDIFPGAVEASGNVRPKEINYQ